MKVLFYSPYLNILGGGEYHLLSLAHCLAQQHQVYLVWRDRHILTQAQARFNLDLSSLTIIPFLPPRFQLRQFNLLFFVSDGSIPFLPVSKAALFFMSPFRHVHGRSLINQIKLKFINQIICNSYYTKKFIDQEFGVNSQVIYPAVMAKPASIPKQNLILSVGRFSQTLHRKNQAALVKVFVKLESQLPDWRLILAGGTETGSSSLLTQLHRQIRGHRISLKANISPNLLSRFYTQAKIYWHATGFDEDLTAYPQRAEHFGISIVEAMAHGAVPLVFAAGGPLEIVTPSSGKTWTSLSQLTDQTLTLAHNDLTRRQLAHGAKLKAQDFGFTHFCRTVHDILKV